MNNKIIEVDETQEIYWIRRNPATKQIYAALVERYFKPEQLADELEDMRRFGEIERVLASRITIGEALKGSA